MKIIKTKTVHGCCKFRQPIPLNTKTVQITENGWPTPIRCYYHLNCGLSVIAEFASEVEMIIEKEGLPLTV